MSNKGYIYILSVALLLAGVISLPVLTPADSGGRDFGQGGFCGRGWYEGQGSLGYRQNLTDDQVDQLEKERGRFLEETASLRHRIAGAERTLNAVIDKDNPDAAKAVAVQKELSDLWARFDQKQLAHRIAIRTIVRESGGGPRIY